MKIVRLHHSGYPTDKFYEEDFENLTFLECLRKVHEYLKNGVLKQSSDIEGHVSCSP